MLKLRDNIRMNMYQHRRERLQALIDAEYGGKRVLFGDKTGLSDSRLAQLLSSTFRKGMAFSEKTARKLEELAGLPPLYFDQAAGAEAPNTGIRVLHPDDPLPEDVVLVPEWRIEFAAGNGRQAVFEIVEETEPANYRLSWFQKERINPAHVRRVRVTGDSQEPFLYDGDVVLINLDETQVVDAKLYAIRYDDDLRIKFLFKKLDGTLILRSVNAAYPDEEVSPDLANEHISIIGRVRDKSGKGGL